LANRVPKRHSVIGSVRHFGAGLRDTAAESISVAALVMLVACSGDQPSSALSGARMLLVPQSLEFCSGATTQLGVTRGFESRVVVSLPAQSVTLPRPQSLDGIDSYLMAELAHADLELTFGSASSGGTVSTEAVAGVFVDRDLLAQQRGGKELLWLRRLIFSMPELNLTFMLGKDVGQAAFTLGKGTTDNRRILLCAMAGATCSFRVPMEECDLPGASREQVDIELSVGTISFSLARLATPDGFASRLLGAAGRINGQAFSQLERLELVYFPSDITGLVHNFAVRFPEPISNACGIAVLSWPDDPVSSRRSYLFDCAFKPIAELTFLEPVKSNR
jgi:hypothetical protein